MAKEKSSSKTEGKEENPAWWAPSLVLFSRLSGWIAMPVLIAVFLGKWLDRKYETEPFLLLLCVFLAFIGSSIGIVREGKKAMEEISKK